MQIKIFTIPVVEGEQELEQMNHFLRSHRVSDVQSEVVQNMGTSWWTFKITYLQQGVPPLAEKPANTIAKSKIDYKAVLDEKAFARFSRMREIRMELAKRDAVQPFIVFTDAELAEIAQLETPTLSQIQKIKGIGAKKVEKYASFFVLKTEETDETSGQPDVAVS